MPKLTASLRQQILELVAGGKKQAAVARRFGVSESTVSKLVKGTYSMPRDHEETYHNHAAANAERCPGCGGKVYEWPCLECLIS